MKCIKLFCLLLSVGMGIFVIVFLIKMQNTNEISREIIDYPWELVEVKEEFPQLEGVSIKIDKSLLSTKRINYSLVNKSEHKIEYDEWYELYVEVSGQWYKINRDYDGTLLSYFLEPNKVHTISENWCNRYGELVPGKYRISKKVTVDEVNYNLTGEFLIRE